MKDKNRNDINVNIPASAYFVGTAHEVFDTYFAKLGANSIPDRGDAMVRYETAEWFAEVIYLPYDGPKYSPRVEIGVIPEPKGDPRRHRIDVLHTTPSTSDLRRYNLSWKYTNEQEALQSFIRVRDEIVTPYATPFLNDVSKLQILLEKRAQELDRQWEDEIRRHNEGISH